MPKAFPKEFREDVIRVYRDSDASMAQVAKDFGISASCLKRWLTIDDKKPTNPSPGGRAANESELAIATLRQERDVAETEAQHWHDLLAVNLVRGGRTGAFADSRTLVVADSQGIRPYLLLSRDGRTSVVRLGVVIARTMTHTEAWQAAEDAAGDFDARLQAVSEEVQARFHEQVQETDDPYFLLERVQSEAVVPRLLVVARYTDPGLYGGSLTPGDLVRALSQPGVTGLSVGDRVLLARRGTRDLPGLIERLDDDGVMWCRVVERTS